MFIPTDEYLDEVEERDSAATPGPWKYEWTGVGEIKGVCDWIGGSRDAEFISHAREDITNLTLGCRNLKAQRDALKAALEALYEATEPHFKKGEAPGAMPLDSVIALNKARGAARAALEGRKAND